MPSLVSGLGGAANASRSDGRPTLRTVPPTYRTPAPEEDVLAEIGRTVFRCSYLEWGVIWAVAWVRNDTSIVSKRSTCGGGGNAV